MFLKKQTHLQHLKITLNKALQFFLIILIKIYQYTLSPLLGQKCRFIPTCSEYACEAIQHHSPLKAVYYIGKRILRCHPFAKSGYDPIPDNNINSHLSKSHKV